MSLIDVTAEDDLLIDSKIDRASLDLRLSIAYDVDNCSEHLKDKVKSRPSLAWDNAFFTSAGILDLRELSLVNDGFNNPDDQTSKICDKRRLTSRLPRGGGRRAQEAFLDFKVNEKQNLVSMRHNTREPKTNISSSWSQTRMKNGQVHPQSKFANQQTRKSTEMSSAQKQERHMRPPRAQTRASVNLASAAKSPISPLSKSTVSSSAGKRWLSKSLDFKGENVKKIGSPHKLVTIDCNVAQVPENSKPSGTNKAQMKSSTTQIGGKAKRTPSPLPGDLMNTSKKPSRIIQSTDFDNCATRSPISRGRGGIGKDCKASGGLKRVELRKTSTHSSTKMARSVYKDDQKENMFHVECDKFHGGLANKKYVEITSLFEGLVIEPKGVKPKRRTPVSRLVSSAPTLRPKTKQSSRAMEARDDVLRRSAFI